MPLDQVKQLGGPWRSSPSIPYFLDEDGGIQRDCLSLSSQHGVQAETGTTHLFFQRDHNLGSWGMGGGPQPGGDPHRTQQLGGGAGGLSVGSCALS